jgi:hypothetical protein
MRQVAGTASIDIQGAPIPIKILVQSPADTAAELQVICLFRSSAENSLHGSLMEINEKLKGLIEHIRRPDLFRGELGETLLIAAPKDSLAARKLLLIGLGDSQTFSAERMQLAGEILFTEASRINVSHPFFAPTILDGGVTKFTTGEIAEQVMGGFLRAAAISHFLRDEKASDKPGVAALTYLAGEKNISSTRAGIEKAIAAAAPRKKITPE